MSSHINDCSVSEQGINTQGHLDEMEQVSSSLTKVLSSNLALSMQHR